MINAKKKKKKNRGKQQNGKHYRDLFKKIRGKGIFLAKMGTIKDRCGMDLTKAEDIMIRWPECTELYKKKIFMTQITTMVLSFT